VYLEVTAPACEPHESYCKYISTVVPVLVSQDAEVISELSQLQVKALKN